jgi:2-oxoglutarate ferredoxin oxidoreductase subunit gamma
MNREIYRILIAGEGGQGVQLIAQVLARAAFEEGLNVAYLPNYGVEQRGGVSLAFLQIGTGVIGFPKFSKADIVVNLRSRAIERTFKYVDDETLYIYDSNLIESTELKHITAEKLAIPATSFASKKLEPKVFNMIMAGVIATELKDFDVKYLEKALDEVLAEKYLKKPELRHLNKKALEIGGKLAKEAYKAE